MHALRPAFTSDTPATGDEESDEEADFEGFTPTEIETAAEKLESLMEKEQQLCDLLDEWTPIHKDVETTGTLSTEEIIQQVGT